MSLFETLRERPPPERKDTAMPEAEPRMALMLAQQAVTRWQFELQQPEPIPAAERELALQRIAALRERVLPFRHFVDMAIRFEAEEILVALADLDAAYVRLVRHDAPWRKASVVLAELSAARRP
jgi:hypothetical protein